MTATPSSSEPVVAPGLQAWYPRDYRVAGLEWLASKT